MLSLSVLSLLVWVVLTGFRGRFWQLAFLPETNAPAAPPRTVAVVIPARDEAEGIASTVESLLTQTYDGTIHLFLVDDHSGDGTADLARQAAARAGASDRLTVITGQPLPAGWTGKLWAVHQGLAEAQAMHPDFILLTDADITHAKDNVRHLVACAQTARLDLVSLMVRLNCTSFVERALIPAFVYFFFMLYPQRWIANPAARTAGAAGGCMLVRPEALARIGGIAAIRGALIDDCTLAAAIKKTGGKILLGVTNDTVSSRRYQNAAEIWNMIARTAFTQLHYSSLLLVFTLAALGVVFVVPPLMAVGSNGEAALCGAIAWVAMAISFQPTLRLYRQNPLWGLALPLIALFYASATAGSAIRYWRGHGGQWKGRAQA